MSSITIRPFTAADLPKLKEVHDSIIPVPYANSFFINQLIQSTGLCLIAIDESHDSKSIAGFVTSSLHFKDGVEHHIQLLTLGVVDGYQKQGLARQLVCKVVSTLTPPGMQIPVYTHVCTTNTPAQNFYERLGMKPRLYESQPVIARNVFTFSAHGHPHKSGGRLKNDERADLFRSRDAYVMEGVVTA
ncbi:acyl-CoA N-acyltransferase [Marasmius fiardii PR-910]|nr:acyl-CoA N-acyltransferase [Marasmius fiardii PR-910]